MFGMLWFRPLTAIVLAAYLIGSVPAWASNGQLFREAFLADAVFLGDLFMKQSSLGVCEMSTSVNCSFKENAAIEKIAEDIESQADYRTAMELFIAQWNEPHLQIEFAEPHIKPEEWSGWAMSLEDGRPILTYVAGSSNSQLRFADSFVINCEFSSENTSFKILFSSRFERTKFDSSYVAVHDEKQRNRCLTENGWLDIARANWDKSEYLSALGSLHSKPSAQFGLVRGKSGWLLGLPSFREDAFPWAELFSSLVEKRDLIGQSGYLVIDVRGNTGGSSRIGENVVNLLMPRDNSRVGPFESTSIYMNTGNLVERWIKEHQPDLLTEFLSAQKRGEPLSVEYRRQATVRKNFINKDLKVAVIIDKQCFSSCLMFLDSISSFSNVVLAGSSSGSDTRHGEAMSHRLPSNLGTVTFPIKYWADRKRGREAYDGTMELPRKAQGSLAGLDNWANSMLGREDCSEEQCQSVRSVSSRPVVVSSEPESGARVPAGETTLVINFDRPMKEDSYSLVALDDRLPPSCQVPPEVSEDGRTFSFRCLIEPNRHYSVGLNSPRFKNFKSSDGVSLSPWKISFYTRD